MASSTTCRRPGMARSRLLFSVVTILAVLSSAVDARTHLLQPRVTATASLSQADSPLHLDTRTPLPSLALNGWGSDLRRRQRSDDEDEDEETTSEDRRSTEDEDDRRTSSEDDDRETASRSLTTMTVPVTRSSTQTSTTAEATSSSLPQPFDDSIDEDFRVPGGDDSCPNFINTLLNSATFQSCYPISMLIQTSTQFFEAQKQLGSIVQVLDATCGANLDFCTTFLDEAARNLTESSNCKEEFDAGTSSVMLAYNGLRAYETLYKSTCLVDKSDMYCFASAVTNTTARSDGYLYFMPLGKELPGAATPSCNWCVRETMGIYHTESARRDRLISETYEPAAFQINTLCGPETVNAELPEPDTAMGATFSPKTYLMTAGLFIGIALNLL